MALSSGRSGLTSRKGLYFYALCGKQMVFQSTCLDFFMVQFQEIECHTNEIPFYRNIGISSGQESAEVHILVNRGECALHRWMKYLETSSLLDTVFHWLFVSLLLMIVLFFDRAVFTVRTFVDNLYNLLASCCTS